MPIPIVKLSSRFLAGCRPRRSGGCTAGPAGETPVTSVPRASRVARGTGPLRLPAVQPPDLRGRQPARNRELSFTMGMGMGGVAFGFDGRPFDHERTDQAVRAGAVEDWTIRNTTPMDHPFHLHVWPMQIIDDNGLEPA